MKHLTRLLAMAGFASTLSLVSASDSEPPYSDSDNDTTSAAADTHPVRSAPTYGAISAILSQTVSNSSDVSAEQWVEEVLLNILMFQRAMRSNPTAQSLEARVLELSDETDDRPC